MPAPIITGVTEFIAQNLNVAVWDSEIPRYDTFGNPIGPDAGAVSPSVWPVFRVVMREPGLDRNHTFVDPYDDQGELLVQMYATRRDQLESPRSGPNGNQTDTPSGLVDQVERLLAKASNWRLIDLGGPAANPFYVVGMLLKTWYVGQEEGVRTQQQSLLYRADMLYHVTVHGAVSSS